YGTNCANIRIKVAVCVVCAFCVPQSTLLQRLVLFNWVLGRYFYGCHYSITPAGFPIQAHGSRAGRRAIGEFNSSSYARGRSWAPPALALSGYKRCRAEKTGRVICPSRRRQKN